MGRYSKKASQAGRRYGGCINYDLHRSVEDPGTFMFYENWESRPLWEQHMESPHLQEFSSKQEELAETWELFLGEKV